jgi:hypothetical protein
MMTAARIFGDHVASAAVLVFWLLPSAIGAPLIVRAVVRARRTSPMSRTRPMSRARQGV